MSPTPKRLVQAGHRIRTMRQALGLTQGETAVLALSTQTAVSFAEAGRPRSIAAVAAASQVQQMLRRALVAECRLRMALGRPKRQAPPAPLAPRGLPASEAPYRNAMGRRLRLLRQRVGATQAHLAKAVGSNQTTVSLCERGGLDKLISADVLRDTQRRMRTTLLRWLAERRTHRA